MDVLKALWNDSVWSKVIAALIIFVASSILSIVTSVKLKWIWRVKLTMTNRGVSSQPGAGYPLKYYIEMRNDSVKSIEVKLLSYSPKAISVKSFPPEVMQVRFHSKWFPPDQGADKVAVLPGQLCRAWIGIDEGKFKEEQVKMASGSIGTLVVSANNKRLSFEL